MPTSFRIIESRKVGLDTPESYIVVREGASFLRVTGDEPNWSLSTATAGEDRGGIEVCPEQSRLIEAALRLGAEIQTEPLVLRDREGREYVRICWINRAATESEEAFDQGNVGLFTRFFEIFDELQN